jgi:hypothetical protein
MEFPFESSRAIRHIAARSPGGDSPAERKGPSTRAAARQINPKAGSGDGFWEAARGPRSAARCFHSKRQSTGAFQSGCDFLRDVDSLAPSQT